MSAITSSFWSSNVDFNLPAQSGSNTIVTASVALAEALKVDPSQITGTTFRSWTPLTQYLYLNYLRNDLNRTESPVTIGPAGGDRITARMDDVQRLALGKPGKSGTVDVYRAVDPLPASQRIRPTAEEFALSPSEIDPNEFLKWNDADQLAWVDQHKTEMQFPPLRIENSKGTLYTALINQITVTDLLPYQQLPGSTAGNPNVSKVPNPFPDSIDGADVKLPVSKQPKLFNKAPSAMSESELASFLEDFPKWHSGYQLEYVRTHGVANSNPPHLVIPADATLVNGQTPLLEVFVSKADKSKLITATALDKSAIAMLALEDQKYLTTLAAFTSLGSKAGLASVSALKVNDIVPANRRDVTTKPSPNTPEEVIKSLRNYIDNAPTSFAGAMPATDRGYFTKQLDILNDQLKTMGVVSPAQLENTLTELKTRFDRALAFWDVKTPGRIDFTMDNKGGTYHYTQVFSLETSNDINDYAVRKGYAIFIAQEKRMFEMQQERAGWAKTGVYEGQTMDAPSLVYRFQVSYNSQKEAEVVAETEEINQQNLLLKTYAAMQEEVNKVMQRFDKTGEDNKKYMFSDDKEFYPSLNDVQKRLLAMFEDDLSNGGRRQGHPLERLNSINRPTYNMVTNSSDNTNFDLNSFTHGQWNIYAQRLSEAVTQINQNSQLQMNKVNSLDKERNRHFELANSALSKMSEMLQNIARS